MELKIYSPDDNEYLKSIEWNHEDIKSEVTAKMQYYNAIVYDESQIKEAKADRATLNKFIAALDEKRKEIKKQCLAPYEEFEIKMKEIVSLVNEPVALIDSQIKIYDERQKELKRASIQELFDSAGFQNFVKLEMIFEPKWLNVSVSIKQIEEQLKMKMYQIGTDLATLSKLPEFSFEATEVYKETLDLNRAISEGQRLAEIQRRKVAAEEATNIKEIPVEARNEASVQESAPEPELITIYELKFSVQVTRKQAMKLKQFFEDNKINYRKI